jgi:hypothetical protein
MNTFGISTEIPKVFIRELIMNEHIIRRRKLRSDGEIESPLEQVKDDLMTVLEYGSHPDPATDQIIKRKIQTAFEENAELRAMVEATMAFEEQALKNKKRASARA